VLCVVSPRPELIRVSDQLRHNFSKPTYLPLRIRTSPETAKNDQAAARASPSAQASPSQPVGAAEDSLGKAGSRGVAGTASAGTSAHEALPPATVLEKMRVKDLGAMLKARGLTCTGKKEELVRRLVEFCQRQQRASAPL